MSEMGDWRSASDRSGATSRSGRYARSAPSQYGSEASFSTSMGRFDTCILSRQTIEPQTRHTLYKLEVDGGTKKWAIYRRYRDFVLLNKKLRKLFPNFVLTLPPKRLILDNFNQDFIQKRQTGLEEYVRNILNHAEISQSPPVVRFFRLENPPQPHESLDASQNYCEVLEHTVIELKQECRDLEDEINGLKNDLASSYHTQEEAKGRATHYEKQYSWQGSELQELNQRVATAQCAELRAREETDKLREEIKTERAHVRAVGDIEKHKHESAIKTQWEQFHRETEDVNQQLNTLVSSFSQLSNVNVTIAGKSFEVKAAETMVEHTQDLKKAIDNSRQQQESIYKNMVERYNKEIQELKAELARADFIAQTRNQEAETLRAEMKEIQTKYTNDIMVRDNTIQELQQQLQESHATSNGTEQNLYNRVKANGILMENWPSWVSREMASFPNPF